MMEETPRMERKLFTVTQANKSLPRVSRLMKALQERFQWLKAKAPREPYAIADYNIVKEGPVDPAYFRALLQVRRLIKGIETMGVQIKDIKSGLVDFPARMYGRDVLLCWKMGETRVGFWHDPEAGYAGRQPLPDQPPDSPGADEDGN